MRAWVVAKPGPIDTGPLELVDLPVPRPGPGQVRLGLTVCGVCRTDLHLSEGDLPPHRPRTVPGHEAVGVVVELGPGCSILREGQRAGAAWLASSCGRCRFCTTGRENLCLQPVFTGWDVDGGFADYMVADERFLYPLPDSFDDVSAAPLLCAGIIGYRALRRSDLPAGGKLGLYGFGGSAHLTAQVAISEGATVHVITRSEADQALARRLGAATVGGPATEPPELLDSAVLFAPAGELVPVCLAALDRGGTLAIAGIHMTDIPSLDYQRHLFQERTVRSVTANTRADGTELLSISERIRLQPETVEYPFSDLPQALSDLAHDRFSGAAVIRVDGA